MEFALFIAEVLYTACHTQKEGKNKQTIENENQGRIRLREKAGFDRFSAGKALCFILCGSPSAAAGADF
jgi:hypothetical protein